MDSNPSGAFLMSNANDFMRVAFCAANLHCILHDVVSLLIDKNAMQKKPRAKRRNKNVFFITVDFIRNYNRSHRDASFRFLPRSFHLYILKPLKYQKNFSYFLASRFQY